MNKKQIKAKAKEKFKADKLAQKDRKIELESLDNEQAEKLRNEDKQLAKQAKIERKEYLKTLKEDDRNDEKYFDKIYKKQKTKNIRLSILAIFLVIIMFGGISIYSAISPFLRETAEIGDSTVSTDSPEALATKEAGIEVAKSITDEGLVLLKNEDNVLPLTGEKKLNVFGFGAMNYKMGGGGSGATNLNDAVSLYDGLSSAGIAYNPELYQFYVDNADLINPPSTNIWMQMAAGILGTEHTTEPQTIDYLPTELIASAKEYSDTAMVVITAMSSEASDATVDNLQISEAERALVDFVANEFENVIVLVNSGYAMDLSFIEEYESIKSVLWIGNPGAYGALSIGNTLAGNINPSGRLNDTYVRDIGAIPAVQNIGDYKYENIDGIARLDYEEGIYVGYRYYETRYGNDEKAYDENVIYPFGYGLSYTTFDQEIISNDVTDSKVNLEIKVTNTGDVAGKEVVQIYYTPPYIKGGIEKSTKNLVAFDKTNELKPGESQVIKISFDLKDMSSWDLENGNYVLDKGNYVINVGKNSHENYDSFKWKNDKKKVYKTDELTGTEYQNLFDYVNGDLTYLSRADFEGTFPTDEDVELVAPEEVVNEFYSMPTEIEGTEAITGEDNGIMLEDLKGLEFDDPMWELFLNQFTIEEMVGIISYGGFHTREIERLGVPRTDLIDGPAGWNRMFGGSLDAASYPTELLLASTWNTDLALALGDAIGAEGAAYGIDMWYAPAMNIHRSPIGGRNFEYFSEDPLISGKMAAGMVNGAQKHNVMVTIKHFALNDQEVNARNGVMVWANEQALREIYLKPFEIATKEADATGVMTSFINIGPKWAGANDELLNKLLRDEWGFDGIATTDAQLGDWMNPIKAITTGNELMLSIGKGEQNEEMLMQAYEEMPVLISNSLRDRIHTIMYNIVNNTNMPN